MSAADQQSLSREREKQSKRKPVSELRREAFSQIGDGLRRLFTALAAERSGIARRAAPIGRTCLALCKIAVIAGVLIFLGLATAMLWVLYDVPTTVKAIDENGEERVVKAGARQGKNDWGRTGYGGPCPPIGRHRYFFKLYALDTTLVDLRTPTKRDLEQAMEGHVLASAELMGTYQRAAK